MTTLGKRWVAPEDRQRNGEGYTDYQRRRAERLGKGTGDRNTVAVIACRTCGLNHHWTIACPRCCGRPPFIATGPLLGVKRHVPPPRDRMAVPEHWPVEEVAA